MDAASIRYYAQQKDNRAAEVPLWLSGIAERILRPGDRVFEAGCGSGAFARWLARSGFRVLATDAVWESADDISAAGNPEFRRAVFPLEDADELLKPEIPYQAVFCVDMLMHISERRVLSILHQFQRMLALGGFLVVSTCRGIPDLNRQSRDSHGVLFCQREADQYALLLERLGFELLEKSTGEEVRDGVALVRDTVVGILRSRITP